MNERRMTRLLWCAIWLTALGLLLLIPGLWRVTGLTLLAAMGFAPFFLALGVILYVVVVLVDLRRRRLL